MRRQKALRESLESAADPLEVLRAMAKQALAGDAQAAALVMSYVVGRPRTRTTTVELPSLDDLRDARRLLAAAQSVAQAVGAGSLALEHAQSVLAVLTGVRDLQQTADLLARIEALEAKA
jgi:hypothetical protein